MTYFTVIERWKGLISGMTQIIPAIDEDLRSIPVVTRFIVVVLRPRLPRCHAYRGEIGRTALLSHERTSFNDGAIQRSSIWSFGLYLALWAPRNVHIRTFRGGIHDSIIFNI